MTGTSITAAERESVLKVARMNTKVAKAAAKERSTTLLADFEAKLSYEFRFDDDQVWKKLTEEASKLVSDADAKVAARCAELGIPERFRPSLSIGWWGRGENATKERRAELRKVAVTRIAALQATAIAGIERRSAEVQTRIIAGGLRSEEAQDLLASLPAVDELMPPLAIADVALALADDRSAR